MEDANAFEMLRYQARQKRNAAIKVARDEYTAALDGINRLARQITKREPPPEGPVMAPTLGELILKHAPGERPFTIQEMVGWLAERCHDRSFRPGSVRTAHHHLAEVGKLRRIDRNPEGHTLWALIDSRVIKGPWGMMTLTEAIEGLLRDEGPLRVTMRRFTRLTNGYSKSLKHHRAMQAVFFAFYNFCRKHETIGQTPAMEAKLAEKQWTVRQLIEQAAAA